MCVCRGSGADLTADTCACVCHNKSDNRQPDAYYQNTVCHAHPTDSHNGSSHIYYLFKYLETGLSPPPPCCCSIQMFGSHNRESLSSLAMAFEALKS